MNLFSSFKTFPIIFSVKFYQIFQLLKIIGLHYGAETKSSTNRTRRTIR